MRKSILIAVLLVVLVPVAGYLLYNQITYTPQDLSPLAPYVGTESYAALIQRIQAQPAGPDGFTFAVLGDTRSNHDVAPLVVKAAAAENPAFILGTGDLVHHGTVGELISDHLPLVKSIAPIPFISVPGNHEEGPNRDFAAFRYLCGGSDHFSFDYGDCRFVGVNDGSKWGFTNGDLRYLEQELSKPGVKHRFVVFHIPPKDLSVFADPKEGRGFRRNYGALKKILRKYGVEDVFMGHIHGFAAIVVDGVRYIVSAGGGAPLSGRLPEEGQAHCYVVVHVSSTGLRMEYIRLIGAQWLRKDI